MGTFHSSSTLLAQILAMSTVLLSKVKQSLDGLLV